jgi:hypothetical protein
MNIFFKGVVLVGALLGFMSNARALELVQSEGTGQPFACVTAANTTDDTGIPVLAVACGFTFASFWQFQNLALEGPGSFDGMVTCLSVDKTTKVVFLQPCKLGHLLPTEKWFFFNGLVVSFAFGTSSSSTTHCLDSHGKYTNTNILPTIAQLGVTPCTITPDVRLLSPTQVWKLK